ncbi:MAG: NAD(+) synthase, partial [Oscillospiraceae bacterium]
NLIGITMPGFGTSDRTYYNALALIEQLGATYMDIPIKNAVMVHFDDIGHNVGTHDVTYENAQARERTQILFDIANKYRGLVVGTGDLSEGALGWCTFSGDHMASYNVNICITKTNIRKMVAYLSEKHYTESIALVLQDILDTPVSPELLPLDENGEIAQCTEEILGPYELHDFFLYYFVKYNMRPDKIFYYACVAFGGEFKRTFILEKLQIFIKRLFAGQFKRSCSPDCAIISDVNLSLQNFYIPSDCSPQLLLEQLQNIIL